MPTPHLAPPQNAPQPQPGPDATLEFHNKLNDPNRWIVKSGVPIFKAHERTDPATGQLIKVDLPKLYRIAGNMQTLERQGGVPIRMTLGHTEPGKPETEQPPVGGYYRNARVQPFGPKGEPAVVVDEWLDPQYASVRKNFPYRSSEYYDDAEQITGVALLTRDPYLDLGVVAYSSDRQPIDYRVDQHTPASFRPPTMYAWNGRRPVMYHLVLGETPMPAPTPQYGPAPQPEPVPQYPQFTQALPGYAPAPAPTPYAGYGPPTNYAPTNYNPLVAMAGRAGASMLGSMAGNAMSGGGGSEPAPYSAPWPKGNAGMNYSPPGCSPQQHPSTGAVYSNQQPRPQQGPRRYADELPPGGPPPGAGGPPGGGGGGGGDPLQQLQMLLMAAVEVLGQVTGGGGGPGGPGGPPMGPGGPGAGPPPGPFPPGEEEGRDAPYSRYAGAGAQQRPRSNQRRYSNPGDPVIYQTPYGPVDEYGRPVAPPRPPARPAPTPYGAAPPAYPPGTRTISGQPVGYALEKARWDYEKQQMQQAISVLYYERDQADTQACVEAIRRLADAGYQVGELEVQELKAKDANGRQVYLDNIATKYSRIGTTPLPPIMGDPTPAGPDPNANRPATQEEMEAALKLTAQNPSIPYAQALNYARAGQVPTGPLNRLAQYANGGPPMPGAGFDPANPYNEPSQNGHY